MPGDRPRRDAQVSHRHHCAWRSSLSPAERLELAGRPEWGPGAPGRWSFVRRGRDGQSRLFLRRADRPRRTWAGAWWWRRASGRGRKCGDRPPPGLECGSFSAASGENKQSQAYGVKPGRTEETEINRKHAPRNEICLPCSPDVPDRGPESPPESRDESSSLRSPTATRGVGAGKSNGVVKEERRRAVSVRAKPGWGRGGDARPVGGESEDAVPHPLQGGMGRPLHPRGK